MNSENATILHGHCLEVLKTLPDKSVHCVVTSPPYYGLRDYSTNGQVWGGDETCVHIWKSDSYKRRASDNKGNQGFEKQRTSSGSLRRDNPINHAFCKCGAWFGELGLEPTPQLFIEHLVLIFREVWRVLRDDGTLWLNLGDSYANDGKWGGNSFGKNYTSSLGRMPRLKISTGLKPKDLMMIPHRTAIALQEDGWYVRQDIVWSKRNPMPESVRDRCTKSHEYIFLLTKSERYFYDIEAIKEPCSENTHLRVSKGHLEQNRNPRPDIDNKGGNQGKGGIPAVTPKSLQGDNNFGVKNNSQFAANHIYPVPSRNKRSVWETTTQGVKDAHFATFPEILIEPCILAGTSEKGCCAACGAPFVRVVEKQTDWQERKNNGAKNGNNGSSENYQNSVHGENNTHHQLGTISTKQIGWKQTCKCDAVVIIPCTVLDIFNGSGTSGKVALKNRRKYLGIDLNAEYIEMSQKRMTNIQVELF